MDITCSTSRVQTTADPPVPQELLTESVIRLGQMSAEWFVFRRTTTHGFRLQRPYVVLSRDPLKSSQKNTQSSYLISGNAFTDDLLENSQTVIIGYHQAMQQNVKENVWLSIFAAVMRSQSRTSANYFDDSFL